MVATHASSGGSKMFFVSIDSWRLDVNGVSKRLQRSLVKGFALGRVRENGSAHVFEPRAHLDREAEGRRQLGDACAHALNAKQHMIIRPRHDADEAILAIQGQRSPVR